ncbi:uncharacterized protein LOC127240424 isoform X2 [Andrographis paniculata]|nr:uncharacterized protein LOC127240424 isoform X2 [Andrographis paniculata]XP_051115070.1 uncharacterized protein LOC127240424 isoform X2 [Andrographis paniculata]
MESAHLCRDPGMGFTSGEKSIKLKVPQKRKQDCGTKPKIPRQKPVNDDIEVFDITKEQPELILQDKYNVITGCKGKFSPNVQFHIKLLSHLLEDQGGEYVKLSPSDGENSWFDVLKKCLPASQSVLKEQGVDPLENMSSKENDLSRMKSELDSKERSLSRWEANLELEQSEIASRQEMNDSKTEELDRREKILGSVSEFTCNCYKEYRATHSQQTVPYYVLSKVPLEQVWRDGRRSS